MPDASQLIRDDHTRVKDLFRAFESESDTRTKRAIVEEAITELSIHSILEEEIFYPVVRRRDGGEALVNAAKEEHHVVEVLAEEILALPASDPQFEAKFTVLAESVKHHIDEEEIVMLPKAAELGIGQLQILGERMSVRKMALMNGAAPSPASGRKRKRSTNRGRATTTKGWGTRVATKTSAKSATKRRTPSRKKTLGSAATSPSTARTARTSQSAARRTSTSARGTAKRKPTRLQPARTSVRKRTSSPTTAKRATATKEATATARSKTSRRKAA